MRPAQNKYKLEITMKNKLISASVFLGLLGSSLALADDAADVRATIERHYAAIHEQDRDTTSSHHLEDFTLFLADGGVLIESDWAEVSERMGATVEFPLLNVRMTDFNAQIYGNVALATFYLVGTVTRSGKTRNMTNRVSAVWVKSGSEWKEAHHHESKLLNDSYKH
jgi:ketosteroid isomerase-like protein